MAVALASVAVGAVLALVAALLLSIAPSRRLNQLIAALLLLRGAATASNGMLTDATDTADALSHARLAVWYSLPVPLLVLMTAREAFPAPPWLRASVWGLAVLTLAGAAAHLLVDASFVSQVLSSGPIFVLSSGPLLYALAIASVVAEGLAVVLAARAATDDAAPASQRTRAAIIGLAFALLPLHSAAFFVTYSAFRPEPLLQLLYFSRALVTVAAGVVILAHARRLVAPLSVGARRATLGILAALAALGALDGFVGGAGAFAQLPGYEKSVIGVRLAFAALVTIAALRFGLADLGAAKREQLVTTLQLVFALLAAGAGVGGALILFGQNAVGWTAGGAAAIAMGALPRRAQRDVARRAASLLLLPLDDPRAVAERARRYAAALEAARGPDGALLPEGEKLLDALRADLGVSQREHDMLAQALRSRAGESGLLLGRYHAEREIGTGATASVLLARDAEGRLVVVKRFHGRAADAVLREARLLHAVPHPRVVRVLEVDRREGEVFLVLEHASGGSLRDALDRDGPLAPERAAALVADALEGLAALHAAGIVHRDVKVENILVGADGRAMLGDFGSAGEAPGPDDTITGGAVEASFATAAPEVLRGEASALPASDVYSAGAVLYRLLTGEHYVGLGGSSAFEARERVLLDAPRLPHPRVPRELEPLLRRMLAKRAAERPTAAEARSALAAFTLAGTPGASVPPR